MISSKLFILFLTTTLIITYSHSFSFWNLFITSDEDDDLSIDRSNVRISSHQHSDSNQIDTFELGTTEHSKFVKEHSDYLNKPPLDRCQYEVIARLRGSCLSISEEKLGKLSVSLLNCQAAAEKRQQYPCNEDMQLYMCTRDMSEATWSAYQIISNRARAVCYHVRQEQFSRQAELAVNSLAQSASHQINTMATLKNAMQGTFESLTTSQKELADQQEEIANYYNNMDSKMKSSMSNINDKTSFFNSLGDQIFKNLYKLDFLMKNITLEINKSRIESEIEYTKTITNLYELQKSLLEVHNSVLAVTTTGLQLQDLMRNLRNMSLTTARENIDLIQALQHSILLGHEEFAKFNKSLSEFYSQETSRTLLDARYNFIECLISLTCIFFITINLQPHRYTILILAIHSFLFITLYLKTTEVTYFAVYTVGVVILILLDVALKLYNYFNIADIPHRSQSNTQTSNLNINSHNSNHNNSTVVAYTEQKTHTRYDMVDQISTLNEVYDTATVGFLKPPGSPGGRSTSSYLTNISNISHASYRCQSDTKNGNACKRPAIKGAIYCSQHFKSTFN